MGSWYRGEKTGFLCFPLGAVIMESVFAKIAKYLRTKETDRGERKIFIQAGVHPHIGGVRYRAGKRLEISLYCGAVRRGGFCADGWVFSWISMNMSPFCV